jgi:hypothetical protein
MSILWFRKTNLLNGAGVQLKQLIQKKKAKGNFQVDHIARFSITKL